MEIKTKVKAVPGDMVMVENYRSKYKPWENGKVMGVKVYVHQDGSTANSYDVWIERPPNFRLKEGYYLHVGDDQIKKS